MASLARFRQRIREKAADASAPPVLIVALGDSVTQGCLEEGRMDAEAVYHNRLRQMLGQRHAWTTFSVINAGCNGESLAGGIRRLDRDVIRHQPDLVLVAYGLNDACGDGGEGAEAFRTALRELVRRLRAATEADLVLLTPNRMLTRDNEAVPARWKPVIDRFIMTQTTGILQRYAQAIREVAAEQDTGLADIYAAWTALEAEGADTTRLLANGINHPNAAMHEAAARIIMKELEA